MRENIVHHLCVESALINVALIKNVIKTLSFLFFRPPHCLPLEKIIRAGVYASTSFFLQSLSSSIRGSVQVYFAVLRQILKSKGNGQCPPTPTKSRGTRTSVLPVNDACA